METPCFCIGRALDTGWGVNHGGHVTANHTMGTARPLCWDSVHHLFTTRLGTIRDWDLSKIFFCSHFNLSCANSNPHASLKIWLIKTFFLGFSYSDKAESTLHSLTGMSLKSAKNTQQPRTLKLSKTLHQGLCLCHQTKETLICKPWPRIHTWHKIWSIGQTGIMIVWIP